MRRADVVCLPAAGPDDTSAIEAAVAVGDIDPAAIVAILGKTEGNGCVNDFTRGYAVQNLKAMLARYIRAPDVDRVAMVMSGGTEGGLSPHWLVFCAYDAGRTFAPNGGALAVTVARSQELRPEEIGRRAQVDAVAEAVRAAMADAGIADAGDVHYVQVKCPLLTAAKVADAAVRSKTAATADTLKSMGLSRGASALGVAVALGEIPESAVTDGMIGTDTAFWSSRASCSAGVELDDCEIVLMGNSAGWTGPLRIAHDVMADAIDTAAAGRVLQTLALHPGSDHLQAVLAKAEAAPDGRIRGRRHTMLDDSDISSTRHARALVGGALAGFIGRTDLFVSGGAEHQGPAGGGPIAMIACAP